MAAAALPTSLKQINSYIKLAKDYDKRDPVVAYFCRMYAIQKGIKLDSKSPEAKKFLFGLMDTLETVKKELTAQGDETVSNDIVGQAHLENITVNLFSWADTEDRSSNFNKNVVKAFYSSSLLYDVLTQFGELSEECAMQQRYAKWKATEIHKCLQRGETPISGPAGSEFEGAELGGVGPSNINDPYSNKIPQQPPFQQQPTPAPRRPPNETSSQPPPQQPQQLPVASNYVAPPPPAATTTAAANIDFDQCSKLCKYAMSALQYEDVDAAVTNLTQALGMLQKR